ncbi:MAG TPA: argininosuccinate synthase [Gemmatimonadales bacterium]
MTYQRIVVGFSGGLDTTFCVAYFKETTKAEIVTVTVDTGGFTREERQAIAARAKEIGAARHILVDARAEAYERVMRRCVQGNVLRGSVYPLCVSAERVTQAEVLVREAKKVGADAIAHGSTGAGNDQVRFDVAIRTLAPEIAILTPIRELALSRVAEVDWLKARDILVPEKRGTYSINAGMWGVTIGGGPTHDSWATIPDDAYPNVIPAANAPAGGADVVLSFEHGMPVSLDGAALDGPAVVERLNALGAMHGVGRGVHVGDTIVGLKGRIAFEAPAAMVLVAAHRELEKLVLTRWQQFWKDKIADFYGMMLHEAMFYDPVMRDIEALVESSQARVTGDVRVHLERGVIRVDGAKSAFSLMTAAAGTYGEAHALWDGRDAEGFTRIYGLQGRLAADAGRSADGRNS